MEFNIIDGVGKRKGKHFPFIVNVFVDRFILYLLLFSSVFMISEEFTRNILLA